MEINTPYTFLSLGSNLGERILFIEEAMKLIEEKIGTITAVSAYYENEPWGFESKNWFINNVVVLECLQTPEELLSIIQSIEQEIGKVFRKKGEPYQERIIDIDIIFHRHYRLNTEELSIPHAKFAERKFVLMPLLDVLEFLNLTIEFQKMKSVLNVCKDDLEIKKML